MFSWILATQTPGGLSRSVEWAVPHFIIGTEEADGVFEVQGDGILPRHLRVALSDDGATLESLSPCARTEIKGSPLIGRTVAQYPVKIRVGNTDMLIDKGPPSSLNPPPTLSPVKGDMCVGSHLEGTAECSISGSVTPPELSG